MPNWRLNTFTFDNTSYHRWGRPPTPAERGTIAFGMHASAGGSSSGSYGSGGFGDLSWERWHEAYRLLDVPVDASAGTVRSAYLRAVRLWHPDRFSGDPALEHRATARMSALNGAYALIADAPLRSFHPPIEWIPNDESPEGGASGHARPTYREPYGSAPRFASMSVISESDSLRLATRIIKFCFGLFLTAPLAVAALDSPIWLFPALVAGIASGTLFARLQRDAWIALSRPFWR